MFVENITWYFPISALVNAVTSTILGLYVLFTGYQRRVVRYLFLFCISVAFWSYAYFFWQVAATAEDALFWTRLLMVGAIFTSMLYFHLVLVYLNLDKHVFYRVVLLMFYLFSAVWLSLSFTPYFVAGIEPRMYFDFWPIPGSFYTPFLVAFSTHFIYASFLLFREYFKSKGDHRMQVLLLAIGMLIGFIGGSTNYPLWFGVEFAPWGNGLVVVYILLTVYAIVKYKFLNVQVVTAELFTGLFFIILLIELFLSDSPVEIVYRTVALVIMVIFGLILIRSVRHEVKRREEMTTMAHSLEKANIRLQELDRQKTEFLSIASHQLRTPLSIIKGYIELIKDGAFGRATKKTKAILDDMDESNERLVKLVDEFLDITRIEQGRTKFHFEKSDINALITSVVQELKDRAADKKIKINWKPIKMIKKIYMDEEKIRHVVFNYIDNAIKYSDEGTIRVSLEKEKHGYTVRVKDQGLGFEKEDYANLFQKFYRGKNVQGTNVNGTGLGIYVCRKFVEKHGGDVWGHSEGLGKGSEFGFWIPGKKTS